ncbi:RNA polymerase sigma factor (sigma-70 family) [Stackebrandtia albiflava]|uniref:RNA polymerase sigma factor (Sigma-70 family) n=1 Tax=Stackebrandtia albiflava TaxID=406432 RepID=A0A562VCS3_9ACTN|nr:sigma-70 family RNA polymerase sigma factor [Stackebrandtia albiflava]TWJ15627.1 RNA polymerase sigma factor (sigma-70 family) [Stackebrandtia albiflava]
MESASDAVVERLLREHTPHVLGALTRRFGHFGTAEDAVQEALLAASRQWPSEGIPDSPRGWLITVASRRMTDLLRSEQARRRREDTVAAQVLPEEFLSPGADAPAGGDDTLILLYMCCHPALTVDAQVALTLRAVGGLTTGEVARAFLVPESTMGQRISRAKQRIRRSGQPFRMPPEADRPARLAAVLHVLYLVFNEGHTATSGDALTRTDLSGEAIRLTRMLRGLLPGDGEVTGLLALMLLTDARRGARVDARGDLVPLGEQDRTLWNRGLIDEGTGLVTEAFAAGPPGPYSLQAAVAALHDEADSAETTDWEQIAALYGVLEGLQDNPMVTLNRAIAVAMAHGPAAGLALLAPLADDPRMARGHRLHAVRAHLWEMAGDTDAAVESYRSAARMTTSIPERRYLDRKADILAGRAR